MLVRLSGPAVHRASAGNEPIRLEVDGHGAVVPAIGGCTGLGKPARTGPIAQQIAVHEVKDRLAPAVLAKIPMLRDHDRQGAVDEGDVADGWSPAV